MEQTPTSGAQHALMNLVLLAHAEIRALRDLIALMIHAQDPDAPVNASNWAAIEAECRRKHLEALNLPLDRFDSLVSDAMLAQALAEHSPSHYNGGAPPA
jgi:hypothetical protein